MFQKKRRTRAEVRTKTVTKKTKREKNDKLRNLKLDDSFDKSEMAIVETFVPEFTSNVWEKKNFASLEGNPADFHVYFLLFHDLRRLRWEGETWDVLLNAFKTLKVTQVDLLETRLFEFQKELMILILRIVCSASKDPEVTLISDVSFWARIFTSFGGSFFQWMGLEDFDVEKKIRSFSKLQQFEGQQPRIRPFVTAMNNFRELCKKYTFCFDAFYESGDEDAKETNDDDDDCFEPLDPYAF